MAPHARTLALLGVLGFSSGLPLYLTGQTLGAWLTDERVSLATIGAFALVGLPYTLKWAWAPLLDRFAWPFLGRRRGWMLVLQVALALALVTMGQVSPREAPLTLALIALVVAVLSASQDVVLDAYQVDLLAGRNEGERASGASAYVIGYRVAILVAGTVALIAADRVAWSVVYGGLAALMFVGVAATLVAREPDASAGRPASLVEAVWLPLLALGRLERAAVVLAFVALFKFGDHLAQPMLVPFLIRGAGFTLTEIGAVTKLFGFVGTVLGGLAAGALTPRLGLKRALLIFGLLQAATNILYALLDGTPSRAILAGATLCDYLANAMGTAAFVAFLVSRCDRRVSATQYALLTSLSSVGQRVFGFLGAHLVGAFGWGGFFVATAAFAVPGLILVAALPVVSRSRHA